MLSLPRSFLFFFLIYASTGWADPSSTLISTVSNITATGSHSNQITVEYSTESQGIDAASYDTNDITVTGPGGTLVVISSSESGNQVTYTFTVPGGAWAQADNGQYSIDLVAGQILDLEGSKNIAHQLQTFEVDIDTTKPVIIAVSEISDVTVAGATPNAINISYADTESGLDLATIDISDVAVTGPSGVVTINSVTLDGSDAIYVFSPPGGAWAQVDNGDYTVTLKSNQVLDNRNNAINGQVISEFTVNIDTTRPEALLTTSVLDMSLSTLEKSSIQITYSDGQSGVDVSTFDVNDLVIEGCEITGLLIDGLAVTYSFLPIDGRWGINDTGTRDITIVVNEVLDLHGNSVLSHNIDSFAVNITSEIWQAEHISLDRDFHINSGEEILIKDGSSLQIQDTDQSSSGYFLDQIEFTLSGLVSFMGDANQVIQDGLWNGFTVLSGGELNLGSVDLSGDVSVLSEGILEFDHAVINGDVNLKADSTLSIKLGNSTSFSQVEVIGGVTINGDLILLTTDFSMTQEVGEMVVMNISGSDPLQGQFTGLPEGALITQDGNTFKLSYVGGDGNDLSVFIECGEGNYAAVGECSPCPAGSRCPDNSNRQVCRAGTYSDSIGSQQCKLADPGYAVPGNEATEQTKCLEGFYQDQSAQKLCLPAPVGSFTNGEGATGVEICSEGYYQPDDGQAGCLSAPAGGYVDTQGAIAFKTCEEGTHSNAEAISHEACFDVAILYMNKTLIELGGHEYGQSTIETLTLSNTGKADLELTLELEARESSFSLVLTNNENSCTDYQLVLHQGESCSVDISYSAEVAGYHEDTLRLISNALNDHENISIAASTEIPLIKISADQLSFEQSGEQIITLKNDGIAALEIGEIANIDRLDQPFYMAEDTCSNESLSASETCTITIGFTSGMLQALAPFGLFIMLGLILKANIHRVYKLLLLTIVATLLVACGSESEPGSDTVGFSETFDIVSNDPVQPSVIVSLQADDKPLE